MAFYPLLEYSTATVEKPYAIHLSYEISTDGNDGDSLEYSLTTFGFAEPRMVGVGLFMNDGASQRRILGSELGVTISGHGELNGYGTREISFSRFGEALSPLKSSILRGMRGVSLVGFSGTPDNVIQRSIFDGFLRDSSFAAEPPSSSLTAQDASIAHTDKHIFYSLAAGSLKSRDVVLRDILAAHDVPIGTIDLPNSGGTVYKAIAEGGDKLLLEWVSAFLEPTGCRQYWRNGTLCVKRFAPDVVAKRTFRGADIRSLRVGLPPANSANKAQFSATLFGYTGPSGIRSEVVVQSSRAAYAPLVAIKKQDHTNGAISDLVLSSTSMDREISRIVTTTTLDGGTTISRKVEEWGWYAPKAANRRQTILVTLTSLASSGATATATTASAHNLVSGDSVVIVGATPSAYNGTYTITVTGASTFTYAFAGGTSPATGTIQWSANSFNAAFDVFLFADGAYRTAQQEDFQIIRQSQLTRAFDDDGFLVGELLSAKRYKPLETYVAVVDPFGSGSEAPVDCLMVATGSAWYNGREEFLDELQVTVVQRDSTTNRLMQLGTSVGLPFDTPVIMARLASAARGALVYGPSSNKRYAFADNSFSTIPLNSAIAVTFRFTGPGWFTTFTPVSETLYKRSVSQGAPADSGLIQSVTAFTAPASSTETLPGAIPTPEQKTAAQTAQPAQATITDRVRFAMNGSIVTAYKQNDFCESDSEMHVCALELLREISAPTVSIEMPLDWQTEEGDTIAIDMPKFGYGSTKLLVWTSAWQYDGMNGQNSHNIECRWYPRELL